MTLLDSLLDAILRLDGEALIMHAGEKPYVVLNSASINSFRGPLSWGQVELSSRPLTTDAVLGMLGQMLSAEQSHALDDLGAIEQEIDAPGDSGERFVVTAARGGADVWVEVRRRAKIAEIAATVPEAEPAAHAEAASPVSEVAPALEIPARVPEAEEEIHEISLHAPLSVEESAPEPMFEIAPPQDITIQTEASRVPDEEEHHAAVFEIEPDGAVLDVAAELVAPEIVGVPVEEPLARSPVAGERAAEIAEQRIGEIAEQRVGEIAEQRVGAIAEQRVGAIAEQRVGAIAEQKVGAIAEQKVGEIAELRVGEIAELRVGQIAVQKVTEVAEQRVGQIAEQKIVEIAGQRVSEVAEQRVSAAAEQHVAEIAGRTVTEIAQQQVGELARKTVGEVAEQHVAAAAEQHVAEIAGRTVSEIAAQQVAALAGRKVSEVAEQHVAELAKQHVAELAKQTVTEIAGRTIIEVAEQRVGEVAEQRVAIAAEQQVAEIAGRKVAEFAELKVAEIAERTFAELAARKISELAAQKIAEIAEQKLAEVAERQAAVVEPSEPAAAPVSVAEPASVAEPTPLEEPTPVEEPVQVVVPHTRPALKLHQQPAAPPADASKEASLVELLRAAAAHRASTVYAVVDTRPMMRVDGRISLVGTHAPVMGGDVERFTFDFAPRDQLTDVAPEWTCTIPGVGRVRCVTFHDHSGAGLIFHLPSADASTADELGIPGGLQELASEADGLVVVAGPRSSGKSTVLGAFVDLINRTRYDHVITIESRIRKVHEKRLSFISQREVRGDGDAIAAAARAALREGPDVLVIEDLRSPEALTTALDAARAGRLVFGSISARTAPAAVQRLIDVFPADRRPHLRASLAGSLRAVIAQQLVMKAAGGRIAAREVLLSSPAMRKLVLDGAIEQLPIAIESGRSLGMNTMVDALGALVRDGVVELAGACAAAPDRAALISALERDGIDVTGVERRA